jgi:hypothetical protein
MHRLRKKGKIPFTIASKAIKHFRINLMKEIRFFLMKTINH